MKNDKFILASASPRRRELLEEAGFEFDIVPSTVDEDSYKHDEITPAQYTVELALAKARDVAGKFPDMVVLGSDCIVELNGQIYEKPFDADDARRIVGTLFSNPHNVITSVAIVHLAECKEEVVTATTKIFPIHLTDQQLEYHINTGQWKGRAGGYGIQDPHTDKFIERIEGSFTNVVGLPMEVTVELLEQFGITPRR